MAAQPTIHKRRPLKSAFKKFVASGPVASADVQAAEPTR
jgi:hypothetical protein